MDRRRERANTEEIPKSILNMFVYNDKVNSRLTRTPFRLVHLPRYSKLEHTTLYRGLLYYNKLGEDIKTLSIKQFKTQVKLFIKQKMPLEGARSLYCDTLICVCMFVVNVMCIPS